MSSINVGSFTLEHDREWRAWRLSVEGDHIGADSQFEWPENKWNDCVVEVGRHLGVMSCRYRRPVPLPSIGELVDSVCTHHRDSDGDYVHPIDPKRRTESRMIVGDWLQALLPGYEEQLAKKDSPVPADGWRPIETAPKDGTRVILYEPASVGYGYVEVGEWIMARSRGFWRILSGSLNPTHWQPLPPPPQEKGGEA